MYHPPGGHGGEKCTTGIGGGRRRDLYPDASDPGMPSRYRKPRNFLTGTGAISVQVVTSKIRE